jgi:hypothetical protein
VGLGVGVAGGILFLMKGMYCSMGPAKSWGVASRPGIGGRENASLEDKMVINTRNAVITAIRIGRGFMGIS